MKQISHASFCKLALMLSLTVLASSCGPGEEGVDVQIPYESEGEVHAVVLENQSQFVLTEIHVHTEASFGSGNSLQITSDLEPQETWEIASFTSGDYITFVRERPDGRAVSVTTSAPVYVDQANYRVLMFDNSFRVLLPEQEK